MKSIYSIGTNGSHPTTILSALLQYKITDLFDMRRFPNTAFASCQGKFINNLIIKLSNAIHYEALPELSPSKELKKKIKLRGWTALNILQEINKETINRVKDLISKSSVPCFLSSEPIENINKSYRKILLEALQSQSDDHLNIVHLDGRLLYKDKIEGLGLDRGTVYDITTIFDKINSEYFHNRYRRADILFLWEEMRKGLLGYFNYPSLIAINPVLDQPAIPSAVTEAVLYHEMIHLDRSHRGLSSAHTVEFYLEEAHFKQYSERFHFNFETVQNNIRKGELE